MSEGIRLSMTLGVVTLVLGTIILPTLVIWNLEPSRFDPVDGSPRLVIPKYQETFAYEALND